MIKSNATVTSKGQVTIPVSIREFLGLTIGSEIEFEVKATGEVILRKLVDNNDQIVDMIDKSELFRDISKIIRNLKTDGEQDILTVDLIREYQGNYYNSPNNSSKGWNVAFGKFLKANQMYLGIDEIEANVKTKDDFGNPTSCSMWRIL